MPTAILYLHGQLRQVDQGDDGAYVCPVCGRVGKAVVGVVETRPERSNPDEWSPKEVEEWRHNNDLSNPDFRAPFGEAA